MAIKFSKKVIKSKSEIKERLALIQRITYRRHKAEQKYARKINLNT